MANGDSIVLDPSLTTGLPNTASNSAVSALFGQPQISQATQAPQAPQQSQQQNVVAQQGPTTPTVQGGNETIQKEPAAFGMRVATPDDVKNFDAYIQNGGDPNQLPVYDRLAVAIAKDPSFLTKPENFESFYGLVYKPL